ncbi:MAG TPA: hypothetical protein VG103_04275 [Chthoniobacterales bacterium]|jgi:hypothetical protein|nr:hypothetical protein [Chthoniobacterales bacterium]
MKINYLLPLTLIGLAFAGITATTVIPPTFDQLVKQAELIFQGTVTDARSVWEGEGGQRHIETYVTFKVDDNVKGDAGNSYTIRMLGGTVGDQTMEVSDAPKFKVGDRDILFVEHNYDQFVPLVGIDHGRFHIQHDDATGRDIVVNGEGEPVRDLTKLGREEQSATGAAAMSPEQLKAAVKIQLKAPQADQPTQ